VQQVETDPGQAAVQPELTGSEVVGQGALDQVEGVLLVTQLVEDVRDTVQSVVQAGADLTGESVLAQPVLVLREAAGAGLVECVEHPRRAGGEVDATTGLELGDVAGEQPVVAFWRGTGNDGLAERRADLGPLGPARQSQ
jgi:hypothetical protein